MSFNFADETYIYYRTGIFNNSNNKNFEKLFYFIKNKLSSRSTFNRVELEIADTNEIVLILKKYYKAIPISTFISQMKEMLKKYTVNEINNEKILNVYNLYNKNNIVFSISCKELNFYIDKFNNISASTIISRYGKEYVDSITGFPENPIKLEQKLIFKKELEKLEKEKSLEKNEQYNLFKQNCKKIDDKYNEKIQNLKNLLCI